MGEHVRAAAKQILVLTLSSDVWKKRRGERKQRRRDRLSEQSSASKEETESVIKEKRINEFTSCKKQQTAHVLKSCSGRGGSEWLMRSFSHRETCQIRLYSMLSVSAITFQLSLKVIYLQKPELISWWEGHILTTSKTKKKVFTEELQIIASASLFPIGSRLKWALTATVIGRH